MSLALEIAKWDNKSATDLAEIYERYATHPDFLSNIVTLSAEPAYEKGATWLLKRDLEKHKKPLPPKLAALVYNSLGNLEQWEAKLHILQSMQWMPVSKQQFATTLDFVRDALQSDIKFLRAWGYSGFYELACQYPDLQIETTQLFLHALEYEAAGSVIARVRKLANRGFKPPPSHPPF